MNCQKCGKLNQYARWIGGEFKSYEKLICSKCGFLIYDEKEDYSVRKEKYQNLSK